MKTREIRASTGQRLLWLKLHYERAGTALNCPAVWRVEGPLEIRLLLQALDYLVARHESLRTTFVRRGRELRQVIHEARSVAPLLENHLASASASNVTAELRLELNTPIDPTEWPFRIKMWLIDDDSHLLCFNLHHMVTDTWSCAVLLRELAVIYGQCCSQGEVKLPPVGWQFSQFMGWQERQISGDGFRRHQEYWRRQLAGASSLRLPLRPAQADRQIQRESIQGTIDAETVRWMRGTAKARGSTLFAVALCFYYVLLRSLTGQGDLAVATVFANRTRRETENTVGFLANLLVLRTLIDEVDNFVEVLERTHATVSGAIAHQDLPYHIATTSTRGIGSTRLDSVVFQMLSERIDARYTCGCTEFKSVVPEIAGRFDLEMALMPVGDVLALKLDFSPNRLPADWAKNLMQTYIDLAVKIASAPNRPLSSMLGASLLNIE